MSVVPSNHSRPRLSPLQSKVASLCLFALAPFTGYADAAEPDFIRDGQAGFVISHIQYALAGDAAETGACPDGMSKADRDRGNRGAVFIGRPDLQQREDETELEFTTRTGAIAYQPDVVNLCLNPELGGPDPDYRSVSGSNIPVPGIDLTGHVARSDEPPLPGMCSYDSFLKSDGTTGIDNQFYRVVGCARGYQPTGLANQFATGMLTGAWGILIAIHQLDDIHNDDHVEVSIFANADPIVLAQDGRPLDYATYLAHEDPRYHAQTSGRIENGKLITEPVDIRWIEVINAMYIDKVLRDARIHATLNDEGVLEGYLAGYSPVENVYDVNFGYRDARAGYPNSSELGPFRTRSNAAIGKSNHMGYTCQGIYHALYKHADGHRDSRTGQCTSISTQYQFRAVTAFVIKAP